MDCDYKAQFICEANTTVEVPQAAEETEQITEEVVSEEFAESEEETEDEPPRSS